MTERDKRVRPTDQQMLTSSWNQNMYIWLRNLSGANYSMGATIRNFAELASDQRRPLRVLEITDGLPLKSLELRGKEFRQRGDMLIYGSKGSHPRPDIETTVITKDDMIETLLEGRLDVDTKHEAETLRKFILPALDVNVGYIDEVNVQVGRRAGLTAFQKLREEGRIAVISREEPLHALMRLVGDGKRFDLAFVDAQTIEDKVSYFTLIQGLLSESGVAYVPVEWWSPKAHSHGSGVDQYRVWRETRIGKRGEEDLEDYLASEYPTAFETAAFPGAKTLIIKGTSEPVAIE